MVGISETCPYLSTCCSLLSLRSHALYTRSEVRSRYRLLYNQHPLPVHEQSPVRTSSSMQYQLYTDNDRRAYETVAFNFLRFLRQIELVCCITFSGILLRRVSVHEQTFTHTVGSLVIGWQLTLSMFRLLWTQWRYGRVDVFKDPTCSVYWISSGYSVVLWICFWYFKWWISHPQGTSLEASNRQHNVIAVALGLYSVVVCLSLLGCINR